LILGNYCTRSCRFCAIETRDELPLPDKKELFDIKEAVKKLDTHNVVITSVTRDDLEDGGAGHFADCIEILRELEILQPFGLQDEPPGKNKKKNSPRAHLKIEVLVPDFLGKKDAVKKVVCARPDVFSHNIETVPRLYSRVRPQADYNRSLDVIRHARELGGPGFITKSGLMVGLGETRDEVYIAMQDLKGAGCDIITIGQYLRPDSQSLEVEEFLHPEEFVRFSKWARDSGFKKSSCSPFTRSSYLE